MEFLQKLVAVHLFCHFCHFFLFCLLQIVSSAESRYNRALLPTAWSKLLDLNQQAHDFSFDVVFSQIRQRLSQVSSLASWTVVSDGDAAVVRESPLDFTLSPQEYIQQVSW